jgi:hypothetical protein
VELKVNNKYIIFDFKNVIKKRIYCIVCKIFISNMVSKMLKFNKFTTKIRGFYNPSYKMSKRGLLEEFGGRFEFFCLVAEDYWSHSASDYRPSTSATNIPASNTSSAELCSIATDDMTLPNELQNTKWAVSVVQTSTSKTGIEFEFESLQIEFNLFEFER